MHRYFVDSKQSAKKDLIEHNTWRGSEKDVLNVIDKQAVCYQMIYQEVKGED